MPDISGTFQNEERSYLPPKHLVNMPIFKLTYSKENARKVAGYKMRCSYRGDQLIPNFHYDAENVATPPVDRAVVRLLFAVSAELGLDSSHVDFKSAFLHEEYTGKVPL